MANKNNLFTVIALMSCTVSLIRAMEFNDAKSFNSMPVEVLEIVAYFCFDDKIDCSQIDLVEKIRTFFRIKRSCIYTYKSLKFSRIKWSFTIKNDLLRILSNEFKKYSEPDYYKKYRVIPLALVYSGADDIDSFFPSVIAHDHKRDFKWLVKQYLNTHELFNSVPYQCLAKREIAKFLFERTKDADGLKLLLGPLRRKDYTAQEKEQLILDDIRERCEKKEGPLCTYHRNLQVYYSGYHQGHVFLFSDS